MTYFKKPMNEQKNYASVRLDHEKILHEKIILFLVISVIAAYVHGYVCFLCPYSRFFLFSVKLKRPRMYCKMQYKMHIAF